MAIEDDEDLDAYFDPDEFGVTARWSFNGSLVNGIFDAAYVDPLGLFEGSAPVFIARASAFDDDLAQGQTLRIDSTTYTIAEVRPDGTGVVTVRLRA